MNVIQWRYNVTLNTSRVNKLQYFTAPDLLYTVAASLNKCLCVLAPREINRSQKKVLAALTI